MRHKILTAKAKRRIRNKLLKCTCDGYWFPHRVGSLGCKFLHHGEYKNFEEDDYGYSTARYH